MTNDHSLLQPFKSMIFIVLIVGTSLLGSCAPPQMPQSAIDELNARWASLPGSASQDLSIVRAWPGAPPSETPSMEIWCVETTLSPKGGDSTKSESMLWLVTRSNEEAGWESAPLMTMSSTWPYQACREKAP